MWDKEKVNKKIKELSIEDFNETETLAYFFTINEKPESYARERKGRSGHFYNPKEDIIKRYRQIMLDQLKIEEKIKLESVLKEEITVELECKFYISIPKNDSILTAAKKELGIIKPTKRPDLDNYEKLLLDAMHNVIYNDDSCVVKVTGEKLYSINPRTEIFVKIIRKV